MPEAPPARDVQGGAPRAMRVLICGASGHAKVVADIAGALPNVEVLGYLDPVLAPGSRVGRHVVVGRDDAVAEIARSHEATHVVVAIGDNALRARVTAAVRLGAPVLQFATLVHPAATVAPSARLGDGTVVMAGAVVNPEADVGEGCIINTGASLDHDGCMEAFSSLGPGAVVGGSVHIGEGSAIAIGATVRHGITIGPHVVVGAGSLVLTDVPAHVTAYGVPARVVAPRAPGDRYL